jgi:hypothetical protein
MIKYNKKINDDDNLNMEEIEVMAGFHGNLENQPRLVSLGFLKTNHVKFEKLKKYCNKSF